MPDMGAVDVDSVVSEAISRHKVPADNADIIGAHRRCQWPADARRTGPAGHRAGQPGVQRDRLLTARFAGVASAVVAAATTSRSAVTDRGIGIDRKDQERVFERFFRADKARSRATGGTGLGLAIVKHVAANHNGSIGLWSQLGTGSTFTLSIPAYDGEFEPTD